MYYKKICIAETDDHYGFLDYDNKFMDFLRQEPGNDMEFLDKLFHKAALKKTNQGL